jgi:CheY-like chemotaxis protein
MKVAVVDDNKKRSEQIKQLLIDECHLNKENIYQYYNTQEIKNELRVIRFDIMILDVILPRRDEVPSAMTSFNLLKNIDDNVKLKKPDTIIGITASTDDIQDFKSEFENRCLSVIEATNTNISWKKKIASAVNYQQKAFLSKGASKCDIYCYTIHGIRTRGEWQQSFKRTVKQSLENVEFGTYKYNYFPLFAFFLPFLRWAVVNSFSKELEEVLNNNKEKRVILFSHSFGTYVLVKALEKLLKKQTFNNVCTIVLSGSVLPRNYNFKDLQHKTKARVVNDCGSSDYILTLSEMFVPFVGMAGKVGFKGTNDNSFTNRYFVGGHSHYFDGESKFMKSYWLPLFSEDHELELIDDRQDSFWRLGVVDKLASFLGAIKEVFYASLIIYVFYLYVC